MKAIRFPSTAVFKFKGSCKSWNSSKGWGRLVIQNSCFPFTFFKDPRYPHCFVPGRMILFLFSPFCFLGLLKKKKNLFCSNKTSYICFLVLFHPIFSRFSERKLYQKGKSRQSLTAGGGEGSSFILGVAHRDTKSSLFWTRLSVILGKTMD